MQTPTKAGAHSGPYKLSFPMRGWLRISCSLDLEHVPSVVSALKDVARVAGVSLSPGACDIPVNALNAEKVRRVLQLCDVEAALKTHPTMRLGMPNGGVFASLFPHQREAVEMIAAMQSHLLGDQMGLGKTASAIAAVEMLRPFHREGTSLILAPKFTRAVWLNELLRTKAIDSPDQFCALESRDLDDGSWRNDASWYFCHYDVISTWWSAFTRLGSRKPFAVILDEVHHCRNPKSQRGKNAALVAATCPVRILLTGTPLLNRVSDLHNLLTITTGPRTWGSFHSFGIRYAGRYHNGYGYTEGSPTYVEEFQSRLATCYLRRTVDEVGLNLPKLSRQTVEVDLDVNDQKKHANAFDGIDTREVVRAILENRLGERTLSAINEARKVTSKAKLATTVEYVTSCLEQGESVVVFTWMRETAETIASTVNKDHPYLLVHGEFDQDERDLKVKLFQEQGGCLVATLASLREGVTLHKSRLVVLHDLDWVPSNIAQAEARVMRIGQTRPVTSTWVVARNSIDVLLAKTLQRKSDVASQVLKIDYDMSALDNLTPPEDLEDELVESINRWRHA